MVQGINLLKPQRAKDERLVSLAHSLKVGSIVLLIFYCLAVAALFSFSIYLGQISEKTSQQIEIKKRQLEGLKKVESLQLVLKQRLSSLTELISGEKVSYQEWLDQLDKILEPGITIKEISITDSGVMTISGDASQATVLARFLDKLAGENPIFSTVVLSSISRQKDGSYLFNVDLKTSNAKQTIL
jgi:hypothetical protein